MLKFSSSDRLIKSIVHSFITFSSIKLKYRKKFLFYSWIFPFPFHRKLVFWFSFFLLRFFRAFLKLFDGKIDCFSDSKNPADSNQKAPFYVNFHHNPIDYFSIFHLKVPNFEGKCKNIHI
jgi:hypothetical protein